jgi:hypothetical protein
MAIKVQPYTSFGPKTSSSYIDAFDNNMKLVSLGQPSGDFGTPGFYKDYTTAPYTYMVNTTSFKYWQGVTNPTGNYSNENGSTLYVGCLIDGNGTPVSLSKVSSSIVCLPIFPIDNFNFNLSNYNNFLIGINSDGLGGWTYATSGSGSNTYEKVLILNWFPKSLGEGYLTNPPEPFTLTASFTYDSGGANETIDSRGCQIKKKTDNSGFFDFF